MLGDLRCGHQPGGDGAGPDLVLLRLTAGGADAAHRVQAVILPREFIALWRGWDGIGGLGGGKAGLSRGIDGQACAKHHAGGQSAADDALWEQRRAPAIQGAVACGADQCRAAPAQQDGFKLGRAGEALSLSAVGGRDIGGLGRDHDSRQFCGWSSDGCCHDDGRDRYQRDRLAQQHGRCRLLRRDRDLRRRDFRGHVGSHRGLHRRTEGRRIAAKRFVGRCDARHPIHCAAKAGLHKDAATVVDELLTGKARGWKIGGTTQLVGDFSLRQRGGQDGGRKDREEQSGQDDYPPEELRESWRRIVSE